MAQPQHFTISVSADGFTVIPSPPSRSSGLDVEQGDAVDFKPADPSPPASVTVTTSNPGTAAAALFGTTTPLVPSHQTVQTDHGAFTLTAGGHTLIVHAHPGRGIDPDPKPNPR